MPRFDYFVVFAEMRTGSNFLEANINRFDGLTCHGEVFNPHFLAYPSTQELLGFTQEARDADPVALVRAIKKDETTFGGFRFFHDHDPRVLDHVLKDPRCAKIVLTRNPIESFVSWKIAEATGQWKLTNATHHKSSKVEFKSQEFRDHLDALQGFQVSLMNALQRSGQTAFYVAYEDLQDIEIMNGLAAFLGSDERIEGLDKKLKKQNPAPMSEKVLNYEDMEKALSGIDMFSLNRTPNFEPRRGPAVPTWVAGETVPLLFMPMKCGPNAQVETWLAAMEGGAESDLLRKMNQQEMRKWRRQHKGMRTFTVISHPVVRAYRAFCEFILPAEPPAFVEIRNTLRKVYNLELPEGPVGADWSAQDQRRAFEQYLAFVKANLSGQTAIRVDPAWASQGEVLRGFGDFALPDMVVREERMEADLSYLCSQIAREAAQMAPPKDTGLIALADIYDDALEGLVKDVYQKDYMTFGFRPLTKT